MFDKPFAIIKRKQDENALIFYGEMKELEKLKDIPRKDEKFETIFALPFSQIKEKNFHVIDEGA
ncbi:MAG: hypothetical protein ACK4YO_03680, partial [Candidatus Altarchaeaceae archaeon]